MFEVIKLVFSSENLNFESALCREEIPDESFESFFFCFDAAINFNHVGACFRDSCPAKILTCRWPGPSCIQRVLRCKLP